MAHRVRLVHHLCSSRTSIRSLTRSFSSPFSDSRLVVGTNEHSLGFRSIFGVARSAVKRNQPAGSRLSLRRIIGFSAAYGIANTSSLVAFAMAANDNDGDASDMAGTPYSDSVIDRDQQERWALMRKVWIPSLFFVNVVMMSWTRPIEFAIKFILALFSTKPNPFSVYIYVEQLCDQYKCQHPWFDDSKPLKANNVDVTDCGLFCIARVVIRDQRFTVIGVLGAWWVWPSHLNHYFQIKAGFEVIKNRARQRLTLQVPKPAATRCP